MPVRIERVQKDSPGYKAGIRPGDTLLSINQNGINDVLDYRFYMVDVFLRMKLLREKTPYEVAFEKEEYEEPGLEFETYLMDRQHTCKNKCVFCFVDQMPLGMRDTLYFKDDDSRMSFLFGNYITLTNLTDDDIGRMIKMHISPINVSVHTTNPQLRVRMMKNPLAGEKLSYLRRLTGAGIRVNTQLVLVPGMNDGDALEETLRDLGDLAPALQSVACVPVGLTKYRQGLPLLRPFDKEGARRVVRTVEAFGGVMRKRLGSTVAYASDEFYLLAGLPLPGAEYYGDFHQLENGVGLIALLRSDFTAALEDDESGGGRFNGSVFTGVAAAPLLEELAGMAMKKNPGVKIRVYPVENRFFGESITVAGLVTAQDILAQGKGRELGDGVLIPSVMLRREGDCFLDDRTLLQVREALGAPVYPVENDGYALYQAMTGRRKE